MGAQAPFLILTMNIFWSIVGKVGTLLTVIGVSFSSLLSDEKKSLAALLIFILAMGYCCWKAYKLLSLSQRRRYKYGVLPIASITRISTHDGRHLTYDQFRHIQIKDPYKRCFEHRFNWSGSKTPVVSSDLQKVGDVCDFEEENGSIWKVVNLEYATTRIYNDAEVVHLKMEIDDSDQIASPHIGQRVEEPIRMISWRVELLHVTGSYFKNKAELSRKSLSKPDAPAEKLRAIDFHAPTKSYSVNLPNPEPGFLYMLTWQRPPLPRNGKKPA